MVKNISDKELQTPVMIVGSTGIGKSYLLKELSRDNNLEFIDLRPATQEVSDLIGIPRAREVTFDNLKEIVTIWARPEWWPRDGTKGILAIEEVNRAPEDVRQALFQLMTEWKMHTHILPKGWVIVSLINPDNGVYHVNQLDPAFKRRFVQVIAEPDTIEWISWSKKNNIDDRVVKFIELFPKLLFQIETIKLDVKPTPAGYHMLSELLRNDIVPRQCLLEVASGIIGVESATTFVSTLQKSFEKPVSGKEILDEYSKVSTKYKGHVREKRNDLTYATMLDLIAECENRTLTKSEINNLHQYLVDSVPETITTVLLRLSSMTSNIIYKLAQFDDLVEYIKRVKSEVDDLQ